VDDRNVCQSQMKQLVHWNGSKSPEEKPMFDRGLRTTGTRGFPGVELNLSFHGKWLKLHSVKYLSTNRSSY
jgi:hypothetical protein